MYVFIQHLCISTGCNEYAYNVDIKLILFEICLIHNTTNLDLEKYLLTIWLNSNSACFAEPFNFKFLWKKKEKQITENYKIKGKTLFSFEEDQQKKIVLKKSW